MVCGIIYPDFIRNIVSVSEIYVSTSSYKKRKVDKKSAYFGFQGVLQDLPTLQNIVSESFLHS